nr:unnamed protein product [Callosobruchus analis]
MTPQLLVPNPKITRFNIASQELIFDFGFIPAGAQMGILGNNNLWFKICDKGDDTPDPSPESKNTRLLYCKSGVKFDFRFVPTGAQMGLLG